MEYFDPNFDIPKILSSDHKQDLIKHIQTAYKLCNPDQKKALYSVAKVLRDYVIRRKCEAGVSIQGAAGTGKSYLLKIIQMFCTALSLKYIVIAPTGIAAKNVNGQTYHS